MSNGLDRDQARGFAGSDLSPNCLPRLSAEDTGRQKWTSLMELAYLMTLCFRFHDPWITLRDCPRTDNVFTKDHFFYLNYQSSP